MHIDGAGQGSSRLGRVRLYWQRIGYTARLESVASRIGPKGQVVIPKQMRDRLGLRPGGAVRFRIRASEAVIEILPSWEDPIRDGPAVIQALSSHESKRTATKELLELRRQDDQLWLEQLDRLSATR